MKVVLDANIIVADAWLNGADFRWLSGVLAFSDWTLCVPRLVVDEAVNKYRERLVAADNALAKAEQDIAKLLGQERPESPRVDTVRQVSKYKVHLLGSLREMGARVMPYARISHRALVKKALERRRPFNEKGEGYRDALIWESVLSLVDGKESVSFVSHDSDFIRDGRLHPDLARDFGRLDPEDHPKHYRTLHDFLVAEVKSHFAEMDALRDGLNADGRFGSIDIRAVVTGHLMPAAGRIWLDPKPFSPGAERARILTVKDVARIRVEEVRRVSSREVIVDLVAECAVVLEFTWEREEGHLSWEADPEGNLSYESAVLAIRASFALDLRDGSVRAVEARGADLAVP